MATLNESLKKWKRFKHGGPTKRAQKKNESV